MPKIPGTRSVPDYEDLLGETIARPDSIPVAWRISCYAIVVRDHRILMVQPAWAKRWELPGGGVELEREETLIEASIRECREETGYAFTPDPSTLTLLGDQFFAVSKSRHYYHSLTFTVLGSVEDVPHPAWCRDPVEIVDVQWLDLRQLDESRVHHIHWSALVQRGIVSPSDGVDKSLITRR